MASWIVTFTLGRFVTTTWSWFYRFGVRNIRRGMRRAVIRLDTVSWLVSISIANWFLRAWRLVADRLVLDHS